MNAHAARLRSLAVLGTLALLLAPAARADGGVIVLDARAGPFLVTAFAAPAPLRAGPVDLSVLVRDARDLRPLLDVAVELELTPVGAAASEAAATASAPGGNHEALGHEGLGHEALDHEGMDHGAMGHGAHAPGGALRVWATREAATNKLLRAALVELPAPGDWRLSVHVARGAEHGSASAALRAGPPLPAWLSQWPVLALPAVLAALFLVNQARRRAGRRAGAVAPPPSG